MGNRFPAIPKSFSNLIHIDDAAQAASAALATAKADPIYVVSDDRPVMRQDYYSRMATLLDFAGPSVRAAHARQLRGGPRRDQ